MACSSKTPWAIAVLASQRRPAAVSVMNSKPLCNARISSIAAVRRKTSSTFSGVLHSRKRLTVNSEE